MDLPFAFGVLFFEADDEVDAVAETLRFFETTYGLFEITSAVVKNLPVHCFNGKVCAIIS